jgi:hypothetical protein
VIDVWSVLTRQGAPISTGPVASTAFGAATSFLGIEPAVLGHVGCREYIAHLREGRELIVSGDRTPHYQQRDLRPLLSGSAVPVLMANGLRYLAEAHTLQFEDLWTLLRKDRTRFMLGQWGHGGLRPDFTQLAIGWFDHYLRAGPQVTAPARLREHRARSAALAAPRHQPALPDRDADEVDRQEPAAGHRDPRRAPTRLAIGATSAELLPDPLKPSITVATGGRLPGALWLPVVTGRLEFGPG